jgi:hypothetical protein
LFLTQTIFTARRGTQKITGRGNLFVKVPPKDRREDLKILLKTPVRGGDYAVSKENVAIKINSDNTRKSRIQAPPGEIKESCLHKKCFLVHFQCTKKYPNFPNTSPGKNKEFFLHQGGLYSGYSGTKEFSGKTV